jgi:hypothetical protein
VILSEYQQLSERDCNIVFDAFALAKDPDATLSEYCEYWQELNRQIVSRNMMCRELQCRTVKINAG